MTNFVQELGINLSVNQDSVGATAVGWLGWVPLWSPEGGGNVPCISEQTSSSIPPTGDHKGQPSHAAPLSPLRMVMRFSKGDAYWMTIVCSG
jgi:hypothetical protein